MPHATITVGPRGATLVAMVHMVTRIPLSGSITDAEQHLQYVQVLTYTLAPRLCSSYTMACPPVRGDNPRALASGLSCVQVDKHGITILYHHQCRPCIFFKPILLLLS